MKNLAVTILITVIVVVLGLYLVAFQVSEVECAIKTTFGEADVNDQIVEPGLYFKWPTPIQRVYKFDSRMKSFEVEISETTTKGAVPIIVRTYVVWRIVEPLKFFNSIGTIAEAQDKLRGLIENTQNEVIGMYRFSEFVNSDPEKIKFEAIENKMLANLAPDVMTNYGIEISTLGIKQLKVSADVTKDVFARMSAERNRRTMATIAQGKAEAVKIKTDADSKKVELLAAAEARAKAIRAEGDAEAARYYKMLEADTDLAMFLRDLESLQKILEKRSTVVLSADTSPFKLLKEMPNFSTKD
jgi:membrane protease subunit HflC